MILARIAGGLGNQLFQYAAARTLADRLNTDLLLDTSIFEKYKLHGYKLNCFSIRANEATKKDLAHWPNYFRYPCKILQKIGLSVPWYFELSFNYSKKINHVRDNTLLEGYFQSEEYFKKNAIAIRSDLKIRTALSEDDIKLIERMRDCESVMVHVRRGDYVNNPLALATHGLCSRAYYESATHIMKSKLKNPQFFIFSDDLNWVRDNINIWNDGIFVEGNTDSAEIDLYLMSQCKNSIIANSSFSWWGAWLNACENKTVIAPQPWFDSQKINESSIIPEGWLRIKK